MIIDQDIINSIFEVIGGIVLWLNIKKLYKDKEFKGVSIAPTAFFMLWGYWNLYYYPSLNQWASFWAGCLLVIANTIWVGQMVYYYRKNKKNNKFFKDYIKTRTP